MNISSNNASLRHASKSSIISVIISLTLCVSMLVGTTLAWFNDSVSAANNVIISGNLDVELEYWDGDSWENVDKKANILSNTYFEPGVTEVAYFKIKNLGSLSFKYQFGINIVSEVAGKNVAGETFELSDFINFGVVNGINGEEAPFTTRSAAISAAKNAGALKISDGYNKGDTMDSGDVTYLALVVYMPTSVGNEANHDGEYVPRINLGINVVATQVEVETDDYGSDYDADATFPKPNINLAEKETVADKVDGSGVLTSDVTVGDEQSEIKAEVPAGVQLEENTTELDLTVQTVQNGKANVELDDEEKSLSIDVHVSGISEGNTVPMFITVKGMVRKGLNSSSIRLYHVEDGVTVEMTAVSRADLDSHNEFYYNAATGDIVLAMASFSEVAIVANEVNHWNGESAEAFSGGTGTESDPYLIANAEELAYFRDLVDGGETFENEYVKLSSNIYLNHEGEFSNLFDPIGWGYSDSANNRDGAEGKVFKGTFDGDRYAIHGLWQNGWALEEKTGTDYTYTNCGGGLFASVENATVKNLVMIDAIVTFECVEIGIIAGLAQGDCTFESIFIYDSKIANYQRATGGVVGEISPAKDSEGKPYGTFTFRKVMLDTSVIVGSLWGDFDTPVGGIIGARWDDANITTVYMDTCDIACELDVYNDVTSTYQWYAYRRAGMLIGNTDTPPADGKNSKVATAPFLTCNDVDVYYTNWAKYNYCQFTNHNSSWPWVRVQAGENCEAYSNPRYGVPNDVNGNKVVDYNHVHAEGDQCNVQIYFDQLYGGGQGVYGQPEHSGVNTDVKYLVTFMHDDHVAKIVFVEENDKVYTVELPNLSDLPHLDQSNEYEWLDRNGVVVDAENNNNTVPAGNVRDVFYYLTEVDKYYVHFVDKDGFYVAQYEFDSETGELVDGAVAPQYPPEVPGYYGFWEPYTLKGATSDVIVNAVYSRRDTAEVLTSADQLFDLLSRGHELSMSQDLSGGFGSANKDVFCTVLVDPDTVGDTDARVDLNSFTLQYNGDSSANKDWTLFHIISGNKLTLGSGLAGFGFLYFDLSKLNSNATPSIFVLENNATLIFERGVVIEFRYPKNNNNTINVIEGVVDLSQYPGLKIENIDTDSENIMRLTVTARTVLEGKQQTT